MLVALPNDRTPAALVQAIEAGKSVFTEKPGARSAAEFEPVLAALGVARCRSRSPTSTAGAAPIVQARELYRAGAIGRLMSVELRMVTTQVGMRNPDSWLFRREVVGGGDPGLARLPLAGRAALRDRRGHRARTGRDSDPQRRGNRRRGHRGGRVSDLWWSDRVAARGLLAGARQPRLPRRRPRHHDDPARLGGRDPVLGRSAGVAAGARKSSPRAGGPRRGAPINSARRHHPGTADSPDSTSSALFWQPARVIRRPRTPSTRCACSRCSTPSTPRPLQGTPLRCTAAHSRAMCESILRACK